MGNVFAHKFMCHVCQFMFLHHTAINCPKCGNEVIDVTVKSDTRIIDSDSGPIACGGLAGKEKLNNFGKSILWAFITPPPYSMEHERLRCEIEHWFGKDMREMVEKIANRADIPPRQVFEFIKRINIAGEAGIDEELLYRLFNFAINQGAIDAMGFVLQNEINRRMAAATAVLLGDISWVIKRHDIRSDAQ